MSLSFITFVRSELFLHSNDWKKARFEALHRAGYCCEWPGCHERGAHVHHKQSRWHYPHLALEPQNLMVLCARHHGQIHGWKRMPAHWMSYQPANDAQLVLPLELSG